MNGEPHLGHVYTTVAADVLARHMRQRGEDVFFLTGTDEHGEPVAQAAEREGVSPRELADRNAERFRRVAERVNATNDFFIRTSDEEHKAVVAQVVAADEGQRPRLRGHLRGLVLPPLRGLQDRQRADRGRQVPDPPDRARAGEGGQLVLRAVVLPGAPRAAVRGQPGLGAAGATATTRRCRSSRAACATSRSAARGSRGACPCRGIPSRWSTSGWTRC